MHQLMIAVLRILNQLVELIKLVQPTMMKEAQQTPLMRQDQTPKTVMLRHMLMVKTNLPILRQITKATVTTHQRAVIQQMTKDLAIRAMIQAMITATPTETILQIKQVLPTTIQARITPKAMIPVLTIIAPKTRIHLLMTMLLMIQTTVRTTPRR